MPRMRKTMPTITSVTAMEIMRAVRLIEFEACWALHLPVLALRMVKSTNEELVLMVTFSLLRFMIL
jgi:hypothetical protein